MSTKPGQLTAAIGNFSTWRIFASAPSASGARTVELAQSRVCAHTSQDSGRSHRRFADRFLSARPHTAAPHPGGLARPQLEQQPTKCPNSQPDSGSRRDAARRWKGHSCRHRRPAHKGVVNRVFNRGTWFCSCFVGPLLPTSHPSLARQDRSSADGPVLVTICCRCRPFALPRQWRAFPSLSRARQIAEHK
jgi:hypothetical protein